MSLVRHRAGIGIAALMLGVAAAALGLLPVIALGAYSIFSGLSYLMYWHDKSAARSGARRTPESVLHLVDLVGGWPGALIAQHQFRHKTLKQPFQAVFWASVVLNMAAVGYLRASGGFGIFR